MNAIIIDDEQDNIDTLIWELGNQETSLKVVEKFTRSLEAFRYLQENEVDVVFLDIEMPNMNGFELLAALDEINFQVVFVTAYNQYAIDAFKYNAIDYLLKPVQEENLTAALGKLKEPEGESKDILTKLSSLFEQERIVKKVPIMSKNSILLLEPEQIVYCESDGNYTNIFYTKNGAMHRSMSSKTLKVYEEKLSSKIFVKTHRSYLVNINHITELKYEDGNAFLMVDDDIQLPISRNNKEQIFSMFSE